MNRYIRTDLHGFEPYHAPIKPYEIKLDANESPFAMPQAVYDRFLEWFSKNDVNVYPDSDSSLLREKLGAFWNTTPNNIVCGTGSDQLIDYINRTFLNHGETVLTLTPTFSMYGLSAKLNHGKVIELATEAIGNETETNKFTANADDIIFKVNENKAKILFLCTPNNPTGLIIEIDQIIKIVEQSDCIVVVDEAYGEFANESMSPFVNKYDNLIVLRTFSKAYGLAGARIGYMIACEQLCGAVNLVKAPYNLSAISEMLAVFALEENAEYKQRAKKIITQKERVKNNLQSLPYIRSISDSSANFLFIEFGRPVARELEKRGVLVRQFAAGDDDGIERVRLTIGTEEQNNKVIKYLTEVLDG